MSVSGGTKPSVLIDYLLLAQQHLQSKGVESPRLDAELLLADALGLSRVELYTNHDRPLAASEVDRFRDLLRRRSAREPVAYITGVREFWSLEFQVDRRVLIPRPETETLVDVALQIVRGQIGGGNDVGSASDAATANRVLEIGTGSGAIAVALAVEEARLRVVATDNSQSALELAPLNARRHGVDERIEFLHGDAFDVFAAQDRFDLIVSNPPYCKAGEMESLEPEVRDWEPTSALVGGADGMAVTGRIIADAPRHLVPGGWIAVEVGTQADEVRSLLESGGWCDVRGFRDLAGLVRVYAARSPQG